MNPEMAMNQGEPAELSNMNEHTLLRCLDADAPKWSRHPGATFYKNLAQKCASLCLVAAISKDCWLPEKLVLT